MTMAAVRNSVWPEQSGVKEKPMDNNNSIKEEELVARIQELVSSLRADSRPEELDRIKKLIKKNVPFTLRGYFSAYLLRAIMSTGHSGRNEHRSERSQTRAPREPRAPRESREPRREAVAQNSANAPEKKAPRPLPADAKTLYINLGKIGHVYAKDLISLLVNTAGLAKEDIYLIRLHDKYSFIFMNEDNCARAIAALQGTQYKGRTIQINISIKDRRDRNAKPAEATEVASAPAQENDAKEAEPVQNAESVADGENLPQD